ncbi:MAG TPA: hypothetical protein DD706_13960 [Nitrospiraceae bacterium]|nr:hypothetical protein [Nitrospiraceae bacterium]
MASNRGNHFFQSKQKTLKKNDKRFRVHHPSGFYFLSFKSTRLVLFFNKTFLFLKLIEDVDVRDLERNG